MIVMKSEKESYARRTALAELKSLLCKLRMGQIRTSILNLSDEMGNAHG